MPNSKRNMTLIQLVNSYKFCIIDNFRILNRFRKFFKNYLTVIISIKRKKYPIKCILKNGDFLLAKKHYQITNSEMASHYGILFNKDNDIFSGLSINSVPITLFCGKGAGDAEVILEKIYGSFPVKDKVVVDVGVNIGDSAIFFLLNGAKKVVGVEPNPINYDTAKKNIEINNLSEKTNLLMAGCSSNSGNITIDPKIKSGIRWKLKESNDGVKVPLLTLEEIMNYDDMDPAVLKIDCEGCEYDIILNSSKTTLRKVRHIIMEYNYGYNNLKMKLEKCGFKVSVSEPRYSLDSKMYVGYLNAERKLFN